MTRELDLHKSTVSRLLAVLETRGLVRREGRGFAPGPELARLGALALSSVDVREAAREPLERLARETGETVNLAVREGDQALNVDQVQTAYFVGATDWTGRGRRSTRRRTGRCCSPSAEGRCRTSCRR